MSRAYVCLVALLVVPSAVRAQPQAPARDARPAGSATIDGRVFAQGTDHPLPRTLIRAVSEKGQSFGAVADAEGRYAVKELPAGSYTVEASRVAYAYQSFGQRRPNGPGKRIVLEEGQAASNIDFQLARAGVVSGRVTDEVGEPLADVQVAALRVVYIGGAPELRPVGRAFTTNDLGEFRIFGLASGRYYLSAVFRGANDPDDRSGYGATYYPGTANTAQAQRITIAPGDTLAGVNFTLLPIRTVRITGTAIDSRGRPLAGSFVSMITRSFVGGGSSGTVRPDGRFTIGGVTPGEYMVRAALPGNAESTTVALTVGDSDIDDLQLTTQPMSKIRGRVVFDDSAPPPKSAGFNVFGQSELPIGAGATAPVKPDFTFELTAAAGRVRISSYNGEWRPRAVRVGAEDVLDSGVDVPVNGVVSDVVLEMTTRHADLNGKVVDADGKETQDYTVIVFAQDPLRWSRPQSTFTATPGANGTFKLRLYGGEYYAAAVEDLEPGAYNDPDLLRQLRDSAQRVTIADDDTQSIVLKLSRPVVY